MKGLSPRTQLIACLLLAGVGLALFFSGEYRDIPLPLGWLGTFLFGRGVVLRDALTASRIARTKRRSRMANGRRGSAWPSSVR